LYALTASSLYVPTTVMPSRAASASQSAICVVIDPCLSSVDLAA
jgi:hypothetical protein